MIGCTLCPLLECVDTVDLCTSMPAPTTRVVEAAYSAIISWNNIIGLKYRISNSTHVIVSNLTSASYEISGLEPFTDYSFFVNSVSSSSFVSENAVVSFKTLPVPGAPVTNLTVSSITASTVTVAWVASISPEVTEYWVTLSTGNWQFTESTSLTEVVMNVPSNSNVFVAVHSYNGQLFSEAVVSSFTTPLPSIPTPYTPIVSYITDQSAFITILNNDQTYDLVFTVVDIMANTNTTSDLSGVRPISELSSLTEYSVSAQACRSPSDCSHSSTSTLFTTLQSKPTAATNITVTDRSETHLAISWIPGNFTEYYNVGIVSADKTIATFFHTSKSSAVFQNLSPATTFTIKVVGMSRVGSSAAISHEAITKRLAPVMQVIVSDPDNLDNILSVGDVFTTTFSEATNSPPCFSLSCDVDISSIGFATEWTSTSVVQQTVASITLNQPEPLIGLTTCTPNVACPVTSHDAESAAVTASVAISGTWGDKATVLTLITDNTVTIDEDVSAAVYPEVSSDTEIPASSVSLLSVSCVGDCSVSASGQPWASTSTIIDSYANILTLFSFGIRLQAAPQSTASFQVKINLSVDGLESESVIAVHVTPAPDAFVVTKPSTIPLVTAVGGVFLEGLTISDVDATGTYSFSLQVTDSSAASISLTQEQCPSGIVMVTEIITVASGSLTHIECVIAHLSLIPLPEGISAGVVVTEVSLLDYGALSAGLMGSRVSFKLPVHISCSGLAVANLLSANLLADMSIMLKFDRSVSTDFVFAPVSAALDSDTVALLGTDAYIIAESDGSFMVFPGHGATFVVSSPITILPNAFYTCPGESFSSGTVELLPPETPLIPTLSLLGPKTLPVCNTGIKILAATSGLGGRPASLIFSADDSLMFSKAVTSESGLITVPSSALLPGTTYTFTASVTNLFGKTSMASHSVSIDAFNVPQVTASPEMGEFDAGTNTRVAASVEVSDCLPEDMRRVVFQWTADPINLITGSLDQFATTIDTAALSFGQTGTVNVTVTSAAMSDLSTTSTMSFTRSPIAPSANIAGGIQRSPRQSAILTMDASASKAFDGTLSYTWTCVSLPSMFPCTDRFDEPLSLPTSAIFDIPATSLSLGIYSFTVSVTDSLNGLSANYFQFIIPKEGSVPEVTIRQTATVINSDDTIVLLASATSEYSQNVLSFEWSSADIDLSQMAPTVNSPLLSLSSSSFTAGQDISVTCSVTDPAGLTGTTKAGFLINAAPYGGSIHKSVESVDAVIGLVTLTTFNWEDREGGAITYQWAVQNGPVMTVLSDVSLKRQVTVSVPEPSSGSSVTIVVIARDNMGAIGMASSQLVVTSPLSGVPEADAILALGEAKKTLSNTGNPEQALSFVSTVLETKIDSSRRMSSSLVTELTGILSSVSEFTQATTVLDLACELSSKVYSLDDNALALLEIIQASLVELRTMTIPLVDRLNAIEDVLRVALESLDKTSIRRSPVESTDSVISILRAALEDVTVNSLQFVGQTYSFTENNRTISAVRASGTDGLDSVIITDLVSVSARSTLGVDFDLHTIVLPQPLSTLGLSVTPSVASRALEVGSVDISSVNTASAKISASISVSFAPVDFAVEGCDYCTPTCVMLSASGWTTSGVTTDGWTCSVSSFEAVRVSMYSLSCSDGTLSCSKPCGNGALDLFEECDVGNMESAMCVDCKVQPGYKCSSPSGTPSVCQVDPKTACLAATLPSGFKQCLECQSSTPTLCASCSTGYVPFGAGCMALAVSTIPIDVVSGTPNITLIPATENMMSLQLDVPAGLGSLINDLQFAVEETASAYSLTGMMVTPFLQFSLDPRQNETPLGSVALAAPLVFQTTLNEAMTDAGAPSLLLIADGKATYAKNTCPDPFEVVIDKVLITHVCHLSTFAVVSIKELPEEISESLSEVFIESTESDDSESSALLFVAIGLVVVGGGGAGALVVLHKTDQPTSVDHKVLSGLLCILDCAIYHTFFIFAYLDNFRYLSRI
mgnify:CR=1 FL=1